MSVVTSMFSWLRDQQRREALRYGVKGPVLVLVLAVIGIGVELLRRGGSGPDWVMLTLWIVAALVSLPRLGYALWHRETLRQEDDEPTA